MKKRTLGIVLTTTITLALLLLAMFVLSNRQKILGVGNIEDIEWYNENGTEFTITTAQELYDLATLSAFYDFEGQTFKLGADIVVNNGNAEDWAEKAPANKWYPITGFAGTFDGQGHTISGIYGKGIDTPMALFADTKVRSVIRDFRLVNSYFETAGGSGTASIASNVGGKFEKIYSDAILYCDGDYCGGMFSQILGETTIKECWFDGSVTLTGRTGGGIADASIIGRVTIKHCLNSGAIDSKWSIGGAKVGGIIATLEKSGADLILSDSLSVGKITTENIYYVGSVLAVGYSGSTAKFNKAYASLDAYDQGIGRSGEQGTFTGGVLEIQGKSLIGQEGYRWTDLNFKKYWTTVEDSTPILQYFADEVQSVKGLTKAFDTSWYDESKKDFTIKTVEELYGFYMISAETDFKGKTVKLGADIIVNNGKAADWAKEAPENVWYPIMTFAGTFDGQGYTISGLYLSNSKQMSGFFSQTTSDSSVKNFRVKNSYFENESTGDAMIGSIAGRGNGTYDSIYSDAIVVCSGSVCGGLIGQVNANAKNAITNAWFDGKLKMTTQTGRYGGGIVGTVVKGSTTMEHCLNTGTISCEAVKTGLHVGGLVGAVMNEGTKLQLSDSLNVGEIKTDYDVCVGAVIGRYNAATMTIKDTYATTESYQHPQNGFMGIGTESKGTLSGGVANFEEAQLTGYGGFEWTTLDFDSFWAVVKNGTPILKAFAETVPSLAGRSKKIDVSWYKEDAKSYVVDSVKDLYGLYIISANTDFAGKTVKLGANIVLNEGNAADWGENVPANGWIPLKTFAGTFDGQGYTISGVYVKDNVQRIGFFTETTADSTIKNLRLENSYFNCTGEETAIIGSIAGRGNGTFDTIYSNAIVTTGADGAGGLIGQINADSKNTITNCWFDGMVALTGTGRYGAGIVANVVKGTTTIEHCLNTGTVSAEIKDTGMHIGGICATTMNKDTVLNIKDCFNAGKIDVDYHVCVGAILGRVSDGTVNITDTYATSECYNHPQNGFLGVGTESKGTLNGNAVNFREADLKGVSAYQRTTLDFSAYWAALAEATPVLKSFTASALSVEGQAKLFDISWYDANATTYVIDSVEDLYGFYLISATSDFAGKTVQLGTNITVNAGDAANWATSAPEKNWYPIKKFAGTFDGKGYSISGIYASSDSQYMGLFAETTETANLKNFKLTNSFFDNTSTGDVYMGSIAGRGNGTFDNIYSDAIITSAGSVVGGLIGQINYDGQNSITRCWYAGCLHQTTETAIYSGGLVGVIAKGNTTIENCLNTGTVQSDAANRGLHVGGLVGTLMNKTTLVNIKHSLNSGIVDVDYHTCVGSIVGRTQQGTLNLEDTFATSESYKMAIGNNSSGSQNGNVIVAPKDYLTGTLGYQLTEFDFTNTWVALTDETPELKSFADGTVVSTNGLDRADTSWYEASKKTYKIYDAADLYGVAKLSLITDFKDKTIVVAKETIDVKDALWMPIGSEKAFEGTFDGGMNTIQGIRVDTVKSYAGLFAQVSGTVKNLRLENSTITSTYDSTYAYVGGVIGFLSGNMENVYSNVDVICSKNDCGGLVGRFGANTTAKIAGCWFDGTVTSAGQYVGGIVGEVHMGTKTILNCLSTGMITSTWSDTNFPHVGGICGVVSYSNNNGVITCLQLEDSMSVAEIVATGTDTVGSVVGRFANSGESVSTGTITNVYATHESYKTALSTNTQGVIKGTTTKIAESHFTKIAACYLEGYLGYQMTEFDFENTWVAIKGGTPELKNFAKGEVLSDLSGLHRADTSWLNDNSGDSLDDAYQIQDAEDLYGLAKLTQNGNNFGKKYIKLIRGFAVNEDMSNPKNEWVPIGNATKANFNGYFDGGMNTISGIYIKSDEQNLGLFGVTTMNSVIKNLKLENSYFESTISGDAYIGSIAGSGAGEFNTIKSSATVVSSGSNAGGLLGRINATGTHKLVNCWFAGSVESSAQASGGLVGRMRTGTVTMENCLYSGTVTNTLVTDTVATNIAYAGGMVGWVFDDNGSVSNVTLDMRKCLNVGSVTVSAAGGAGSVVGRARDKVTFTHVYTTNDITGTFDTTNGATGVGNYSKDVISGAPILKSSDDLKGKSGYETTQLEIYIKDVNEDGAWVARTDSYPVLRSFVAQDKWNEVAGLASIRRVNTDWYYQNANTNANLYTISTAADLWGIIELTDATDSNHTNFYGKTIQMANDITVFDGDAEDWAKGDNLPNDMWIPIGRTGYMFGGTFDGQGYVIRGVYVNVSGKYVGLFGRVTYNSTIKNLRLENSYFKSTVAQGAEAYIGAVAGEGAGSFDTVYCKAIVECAGNYCGGIIGAVTNNNNQKNRLSECWFAGEVTGYLFVGGIVGLIGGSGTKVTMSNCLSAGNVTSLMNNSAGICGAVIYGNSKNTLELTNCLNVSSVRVGSIHCNSSVIGRITSTSEAILTNVYTTNDVKLSSGTDTVLKQVDGIGNNSGSATLSGDRKANIVSAESIKDSAATSLGFDFTNIWQTVTGGTPILQLKIK